MGREVEGVSVGGGGILVKVGNSGEEKIGGETGKKDVFA